MRHIPTLQQHLILLNCKTQAQDYIVALSCLLDFIIHSSPQSERIKFHDNNCIDHCSILSVHIINSVRTSDYGLYFGFKFIWTKNAWWIDVAVDTWLELARASSHNVSYILNLVSYENVYILFIFVLGVCLAYYLCSYYLSCYRFETCGW